MLRRGVRAIRSNNKLLFVVTLLFIFPALFLYVTHTFLETAEKNIETAEKRKVELLHDAVGALLTTYVSNQTVLQNFIDGVQRNASGITEIKVVRKDQSGYLVLESFESTKEGSYEQISDIYTWVQPNQGHTFIFPSEAADGRVWRALRTVVVDGQDYYIVSEHSFDAIDAVLDARTQHAYLVLSGIFVFLIVLAYWFGRQIDWHKRHDVLQQKLKERDAFSNMIAHELRTPITAIRGYSSFLAESQTVSEKEKTFVDAIMQSTGRQAALINDFLEVARIQSGTIAITKTTGDIQPTILAVIEALQSAAKEKSLNLTYHKLAVPVVVSTDTNRLYQILQNLVSHALMYTKSGGVEIGLDVSPKSVSIRIKDTSEGISPEEQQKLFEPFAKMTHVGQVKLADTGLGMWITKQLVEALGGSITVQSKKNAGTQVVVVLKR